MLTSSDDVKNIHILYASWRNAERARIHSPVACHVDRRHLQRFELLRSMRRVHTVEHRTYRQLADGNERIFRCREIENLHFWICFCVRFSRYSGDVDLVVLVRTRDARPSRVGVTTHCRRRTASGSLLSCLLTGRVYGCEEAGPSPGRFS